ncbi:MAG TPA: NrfD/PsrC family molybdoenzyme membrane anchor subunit [Thermoleophilia bacterium]|nr:NrfD/PsrC family molybdoenzyme membrane anchor subunit [Thermoleophilia bacterium]
MIHGELWTIKELFVLPNEYVLWAIQIVMYPFMTGLVAGSFVLSSLYHVFGIKKLEGIARFALVFSFALLPAAMVPLLLHLQHPFRGINVMMTPHFVSAIAAFGIVFSLYFAIVASEIWFLYRRHFVEHSRFLKEQGRHKPIRYKVLQFVHTVLTLGSFDIGEEALKKDRRAIKWLAGVGIPVALFLHGYAGFIFGSVKANALWLTPLMPVIFIVSAIVSGIALCLLAYIVVMEIRKWRARRLQSKSYAATSRRDTQSGEIQGVEISVAKMTSRYLLFFLVFAISLELLDLIFRGYTAVNSWDILKSALYSRDYVDIFILQYGVGNFLPLILLLIPRLTLKRTVVSAVLILFGVFMMRYNVVIGGQSFSLTFAGYMEYGLPVIPYDLERLREGFVGALLVFTFPFILFYIYSKIFPVFGGGEPRSTEK